jgi:hypothetical protein
MIEFGKQLLQGREEAKPSLVSPFKTSLRLWQAEYKARQAVSTLTGDVVVRARNCSRPRRLVAKNSKQAVLVVR